MGEAKVQITEELYQLLVSVHLCGSSEEGKLERIRTLLGEKEMARRKRVFYQAMHDGSLDEDLRAAAKEMYQDIVGVPPGFRH